MKNKSVFLIYSLIIMGVCLLITISCKKDDENLPVLSTDMVSNITEITATCGGNITSDAGATVTARGVCWGTGQTPTIADSKTIDGTGEGSFTSVMTGLLPKTTYYVRAYATNSYGTGYGSAMSFTTLQFPTTVVDADGNVYPIVTIGTQTWMGENLKTTKYNNNSAIPLVTDKTAWANLSTPAYCWYDNDYSPNGSVYGALYNWFSVKTGNLCPTGWHVPTDAEWTILTDFLGGENVAGGPLKETGTAHWNSPNTGATNSSGFTALPGGYRSFDGSFYDVGGYGYWWSATQYNSSNAWFRYMLYGSSYAYRNNSVKERGFSVRCLRYY